MVKPAGEMADLLDAWRQRLDLTQKQFAARLGMTDPTINRGGNQRAKPSQIALKLIHGLLKQMGERGQDLLKQDFPSE